VRGQQDHRQGGALVAQALQQVDAVHAVHAQVGDHAVGVVIGQRAQGGGAAFRRFDVVPRALQAQREQPSQARVVVDQQYLACTRHVGVRSRFH
jgi:hypothetical protein